jgi:hypothetical protein
MYAWEPLEIAVNLDREPLQISLTANKKENGRSDAAHRQRLEPRRDHHAGGRSAAAAGDKIRPSGRTWCSHAQLARAHRTACRDATGAGRTHGGEEKWAALQRRAAAAGGGQICRRWQREGRKGMAKVGGDGGRPVPSQAVTGERGSYRDEEDHVGRDESEHKKLGGFP